MNKREIFNYLMGKFNLNNYEYVILHAYDDLPNVFESDVDIAINVNDIKDAIKLLDKLLKGTDWKIVQFWRHEYFAVDCVISNDKEFMQIDFCSNYERNGRILIPINELLNGRQEYKNFYIPSPTIEFTYILVKKILKKEFSHRSKNDLNKLIISMNDDCINLTKVQLLKYLNKAEVESLINLIKNNKYDEIDIEILNRNIKKKTSKIKQNIHYAFFDIIRKIERILHPTGLFIVLMGVDGAGKTTIAKQLTERCDFSFRRINHYHSRIRILKDISQIRHNREQYDINDPHKKKNSSNKLISLIKFLYYYFDYIIGNIIITKLKIQSSLILIERYYYDYYIDNIRYNLKLSDKFLKFFSKFVKKPDAIFILIGDSKILYERKNEISIEEIEKQKNKYCDNFSYYKNTFFIDTTENSVEECVDKMIKECNRIMRGRRKW